MASGVNWMFERKIDVSLNNNGSASLIPGWSWADYTEPHIEFMASGEKSQFDPEKVPGHIEINGQIHEVKHVNTSWLR